MRCWVWSPQRSALRVAARNANDCSRASLLLKCRNVSYEHLPGWCEVRTSNIHNSRLEVVGSSWACVNLDSSSRVSTARVVEDLSAPWWRILLKEPSKEPLARVLGKRLVVICRVNRLVFHSSSTRQQSIGAARGFGRYQAHSGHCILDKRCLFCFPPPL